MRLVGLIDALCLTVVVVSDAVVDRVIVILGFWTGRWYQRRVYAYEEAMAVLWIAHAYTCHLPKACDWIHAGINRIPIGISLYAYGQTQIINKKVRKPRSALGCALSALQPSPLLSSPLFCSAVSTSLLCSLVLRVFFSANMKARKPSGSLKNIRGPLSIEIKETSAGHKNRPRATGCAPLAYTV